MTPHSVGTRWLLTEIAPPPSATNAVNQNREASVIILTILVIFWILSVMMRLLPTVQQARTPTRDGSPQARPVPPRRVHGGTGGPDGQSWSALDDRQLTRLLIDSAPRTTSKQDLT